MTTSTGTQPNFDGLLGRVGFDEDGWVFELIDRAMNLFVPGVAA